VIPFYQIMRAYYLHLPYTFSLRGISRDLFKRFVKFATPAALNEIAWSLGMTMYGIVFGWMGTESYAARNVLSSFETTSGRLHLVSLQHLLSSLENLLEKKVMKRP